MSILKNSYFYIALGILFLYFTPWVIYGEDSYVLIHDNLDSNLIWFKDLVESATLLSENSKLMPLLMNAPRGSLGSEWDFALWLHILFEPYTAYVVNQIFIRIVSFLGMYLLLDRYVFRQSSHEYSVFIALLYSILPYWPSGGLSVAGLPLISYVFLNIRNGVDKKKDWLILLLFPFYSSFILSMMFYIVFVGVVWLYDSLKREVTLKFTMALFLVTLLYLLINYRLLETFIFGTDFVSHRIERKISHYGFMEALFSTVKHFIFGQYHAHSLHMVFFPFVVFIFLKNLFSSSKDKWLIGLFLLNMAISFWYGFWKYEGWEGIKASNSIINSLNLSRFHFISPLIWYVLFALSIHYTLYHLKYRYKEKLVGAFIVLSVLYLFVKSDFIEEYRTNGITYKQFYSKVLFDEIDAYIGEDKNSYRVASVGIHPAISQYNGFQTLDGYLASYPLSYKHQFRKVIKYELDKNERLQKVFDNWGSRCYVFSSDVGYNYVRNKNEVYPISITIDSNIFNDMGGKYLFSSYEIRNATENSLKLLKVFKHKGVPWDIHLYEVKGI